MRVVYALLTITMLVSCGSEDIVQEQQCKGLWSNWISEGSNYNIDLTGGSFNEVFYNDDPKYGVTDYLLHEDGTILSSELFGVDSEAYYTLNCNTLELNLPGVRVYIYK